ncbi:MAG: MFS transporter [Chlamydiota bacterium]
MGKLERKLDWDKPKLIDPYHPALPWINLGIIILATVSVIMIAFGLIIADSSVQGSLGIGDQKNLWFNISFFLILATVVPIANWCAERFGDKTIFFIGATFFFLPIFFSAFTTNYWVMMSFRTLYALGAGTIFPTTLTLIDRLFSPNRKSLAVAIYIAVAFGAGTALGTSIGGFTAEILSWKAIFLIAASPAPLVLPSVWLLFQERQRAHRKRLDLFGVVLYLILITSLVTGLASLKQPWTTQGARSPWIICCALFFILALYGFIRRELTSSKPLIDIRLFTIAPFAIGNLAVFVVATTFPSTITYLSEIFERQLGYSKYQIGLFQVPFGLYIGICGSISGLLTKFIGIRIPAILGIGLVTISCFTQHTVTIQSDPGQYSLIQALRGIGIGFSLGPFTALALKKIRPEKIGQAAVIVTLFRQFGVALGSIIVMLVRSIRFPFHLLRFGEQIDLHSAAVENHLSTIDTFLTDHAGSIAAIEPYSPHGPTEAASVGGLTRLTEYAAAQARIIAVNDAYYLIGWVGSIVLIITLSSMLIATRKEKGAEARRISSPSIGSDTGSRKTASKR